jgi:AcrR family transcriptional regulator
VIGNVATRRASRKAEIVAAAWELARADGIASLSLHALAREVGIRQPSLYAYFDSKHALYDEMFADGNRQLLAHLDTMKWPRDPRAAVKKWARVFVAFAVADLPRYELLFLRPIPGFEPSAESYAYAEAVLGQFVARLGAAGMTDPGDVDAMTAMIGGLMAAQLSNDPGGNRWIRHLDRLCDLYLDDSAQRSSR